MPLRTLALLAAISFLAAGLSADLAFARPATSPRVAQGERARLEAAAKELRDTRPEARRRALRALVELGTAPAWELVLGALADPDPMVGDEAQLLLARLSDPRLLASLAGRAGLRAKEALVRLRSAEVFGRLVAGCDGLELARAVDRREPEVARALLWSLERAARAGRLRGDPGRIAGEIARLLGGRGDGLLRANALFALAALDLARGGEVARAALREREEELRAAALLVLFEHQPAEGRRVALARLADEATGVRLIAIELVCARPDREGARALIERLAVEPRLRVRWRLVEALQDLSGMRHRFDPRPWRLWLESLPESWSGELVGAGAARARDRLGERSRAFAGLPMLSDRIAFLIDFSGSLWQGKVGDRTRREIAVEALEKALASLEPSASFLLVPYTAAPLPWKPALTPATTRNVAEAGAWLAACRASGKGNVYDAIQVALSDPGVDTLVILTDGAPTGGVRWNLDLMLELLLEQNRSRRVAYDIVLVDAKGGQVRRWERLARESGGRCVPQEVPAAPGGAAEAPRGRDAQ